MKDTKELETLVGAEVVRVIQDPVLSQRMGDNKGLQINIQIVGDSAIEKAAAKGGDLVSAMEHILDRLPYPKLPYLRGLAMIAAARKLGSQRKAADYLKISHTSYWTKSRGFYDGGGNLITYRDVIEDLRSQL